jgi:hypothetical protein
MSSRFSGKDLRAMVRSLPKCAIRPCLMRLNIAKSRVRWCVARFGGVVRTTNVRSSSGGSAPISFPLFHGVRFGRD